MLELEDDELEALDEAPVAQGPTAAGKPSTKGGPTWRKAEPAAPRAASAPNPAAASPRLVPTPGAPARPAPAPVPATPGRAPATPAAPARPGPAPLARPAPAQVPAPRPAPAAPPSAARSASDIPDERVRQIYAQYVETKRQQRESTAAITFEAVAKSLRDSSAKLREKHGKNVDFEVSVKDGKTILKPVLK